MDIATNQCCILALSTPSITTNISYYLLYLQQQQQQQLPMTSVFILDNNDIISDIMINTHHIVYIITTPHPTIFIFHYIR